MLTKEKHMSVHFTRTIMMPTESWKSHGIASFPVYLGITRNITLSIKEHCKKDQRKGSTKKQYATKTCELELGSWPQDSSYHSISTLLLHYRAFHHRLGRVQPCQNNWPGVVQRMPRNHWYQPHFRLSTDWLACIWRDAHMSTTQSKTQINKQRADQRDPGLSSDSTSGTTGTTAAVMPSKIILRNSQKAPSYQGGNVWHWTERE